MSLSSLLFKGTVMKKLLCIGICLLLMIPTLSSCSKPPEYAEIEERFRTLVEASAEINEIFFGAGLPVYERVTDPRSSTKVYEDEESGARYHYYELEDETQGRIIAFRQSTVTNVYRDGETGAKYYYYEILDKEYGRVMVVNSSAEGGNVTLQLLEEPREGEEPYWSNEEGTLFGYLLEGFTYENKYTFQYLRVTEEAIEGKEPIFVTEDGLSCYLLTAEEYKEPEYESFYDEEDPLDYDYVTADSPYLTVDSIKAAAEEVYSEDYLNAIYGTLFVGALGADDALAGVSARYIEYADSNGTVSLMMSNTYEPLIRETRVFDFSTAEIVKPSNGKYVTIAIDSYLPSAPNDRLNVRLSMALQNGVWMLDSATY